MSASLFRSGILVFIVLLAMGAISPAIAAEGQITIGYRGDGWYYAGDTIILNGINSVGNTTLVKVTGPGLAAEGVPLYSLHGDAGSGNRAEFVEGATWGFVWDTSRVNPSELKSGKYTLTVWDEAYPAITSTTAITIKQPEFYLTADPMTAIYGDYIDLKGVAEKGVSYMKINVSDAGGKVLHTFMSPVSSTGSFSYSFHIDMEPGQYTVTAMNPATTRILSLALTVTGSGSGAPATVPVEQGMTTEPAGTGTVGSGETAPPVPTTPATTATRAGISLTTPLLALAFLCTAAFLCARKNS